MTVYSSINSKATFNSVASTSLRSCTVSGQGVSMIETSHLQQLVKSQMSGQTSNATITCTVLEKMDSDWVIGDTHDLTIHAGDENGDHVEYALKSCMLLDSSVDAGIDAVVEFSYTFEQVDGGFND
tara:strand:- start:467 stop:844 length:378 start_codon:yes stop_codon:yes gene_type:complete